MTEKATTVGRNIGFIAAGALVAFSALIMMLFALGSILAQIFLEQGMGEGTSAFLGFGIVALVVGGIGAALAMSGISSLKKQSLAPEKTIETLQEDKQWAQNRIS